MHFYMHSYLHKIFILVKSGCYREPHYAASPCLLCHGKLVYCRRVRVISWTRPRSLLCLRWEHTSLWPMKMFKPSSLRHRMATVTSFAMLEPVYPFSSTICSTAIALVKLVESTSKSFSLSCSPRCPGMVATRNETWTVVVHWRATLLHVAMNDVDVGAVTVLG
jgi:hypothetical protein